MIISELCRAASMDVKVASSESVKLSASNSSIGYINKSQSFGVI